MFLALVIVALVGIFIVEAILTEVESWGWATITLIGTIVGLHFLHVIDVVVFVKTHTLEAVSGAAIYLGAGIVWSFVKWFSFLMGFRDAYRAEKYNFLAFKKLPTNTLLEAELQEEFLCGLSYNGGSYRNNLERTWNSDVKEYRGNSLNVLPRAAKNKARITSWMAFWPFSMVGTIINDPVRRLINFLFNQFKALYQRMADRLFASHPELK